MRQVPLAVGVTMPKKLITASPVFQIALDTGNLKTRLARNKVVIAANKAAKAVGEDYAKRVHEGFKAEGVDPRSGRQGYWPKLVLAPGMRKHKILRQSGKYFEATHPRNAKVITRATDNGVAIGVAYKSFPKYARYHEQLGNRTGYTVQTATARQAGFLRHLGYRGVHQGSKIVLPARRVLVYPPTWKGVHAKLFAKTFRENFNG